jgi:hypothetical protein
VAASRSGRNRFRRLYNNHQAIRESLIGLGVYQKWPVLENAKGVFHHPRQTRVA